MKLVVVRLGDPQYEPLIRQIRTDRELLERMRAEADHELEEHPDKTWTIAVVDGAPVAWAATMVEVIDGEEVLRCCDGYERPGPGPGRRLGAFGPVYAHRHATQVAPSLLPAVTWIHTDPPGLAAKHRADGWGEVGRGGGEHNWLKLRREPAS